MIFGSLIKDTGKLNKEYKVAEFKMKKVDIIIETGLDEGGGQIHFHITTSDNRKICILIFENRYFPHKTYRDRFIDKEERQFDALMREKINIKNLSNAAIINEYERMIKNNIIDGECTNWEFLARYFFITNPDAQKGFKVPITEEIFKHQPDYRSIIWPKN